MHGRIDELNVLFLEVCLPWFVRLGDKSKAPRDREEGIVSLCGESLRDGTVGAPPFGLFFRVKETHQLGQLGFVQEHIEMDK